MGIGVPSLGFCRVCGTAHDPSAHCPGEFHATGIERPGWRVQLATPFGHESIGVLLAPSHDQWRARIVTYPNVLWSAPGGRGTLKFVADTAEEAEARAIRFIEEHLAARRYQRRAGSTSVGAGTAVRRKAAAAPTKYLAAAQRKASRLPVRFGPERALARGMTLNLSDDGMFVGVEKPEECGRSLLIHLELDGHTVPMRGLVMWNRERAEPSRPAGMGIRLSQPPALYHSFVASLR